MCSVTTLIDLVGQQFGRWTAISYAGDGLWICRCECSLETRVDGWSLRSGRSQGCIKCHTNTGRSARTHGGTRTRLYTIWSRMIGRCENPNDPAFANYGGRGIIICSTWRNSFESFRDWALANGY